MWGKLTILVANEFHFRGHGFDFFDDFGRNRAQIFGLITERRIDMHVMCQHLIQHVVLACQGKFHMV